jgi:Neuraminidase (sialidase)
MASAFCLDSGKTKNNATYRVTGGLLWFPNKIARFAKNANKKGINMHIHGKFR